MGDSCEGSSRVVRRRMDGYMPGNTSSKPTEHEEPHDSTSKITVERSNLKGKESLLALNPEKLTCIVMDQMERSIFRYSQQLAHAPKNMFHQGNLVNYYGKQDREYKKNDKVFEAATNESDDMEKPEEAISFSSCSLTTGQIEKLKSLGANYSSQEIISKGRRGKHKPTPPSSIT
ncbi:hypothetical protein L1887_37402 [Cichorium endivia]|nr:hypothetical protein L1887_37402 [Cichorium endivia]